MRGDLQAEVERRLEQIRHDPERLMRYDANGDGVIDDHEWEEVRRVVTAEVHTEWQRQPASTDEAADEVNEELVELLEDRYELVREIGRGGQGRTYLGRDRHSGESVAVKELDLKRVDDWKAIELFEREAEVLESVSHPAIPDYVDAFHLPGADGTLERFFLVQQFVDGEDLGELIESGLRVDEPEAAAFIAEMLDTLSYLHGLSPPVIHRDIKPSNIIRRPDGSLALIDFGAVQSIAPGDSGMSTVVGTSGYMPLEQLMGRAQPATDLYALAATVVHLLSHRHPADLPVEGMALKFHEFVNVSEAMTTFLERMLAPYVEDRLQSASEALDMLHGRPAAAAAPHSAAGSSPAAPEQPAKPVAVEFGRPQDERQGFFSDFVHEASKQSRRAGARLRQEALGPTRDRPKEVDRPEQMRSEVALSDERLHLSISRPRFGRGYLLALVLIVVFSGFGAWALIEGAIVLGLLFNLIPVAIFTFLYVSYKTVDISIDDNSLHYVHKLPHGSTSYVFDLESVTHIGLDLHFSTGSGSNQRNHYRLLLQTHQRGLRFGATLSRDELEYLAYVIDREVDRRRSGEGPTVLDQSDAPQDRREQAAHEYHHEQSV
jgi:chorismate mutase